ncbi:MAG: ATP-binding protein [Archangium sp.]|nr:ATP-binding protein [Archangium sp.]MDP3575454.1 ATP-binding protein [Archangium sp.]
MMALIYTVVGVPFIAWLWILGGFSAASVLGSLVPASAVAFLLVVRREGAWVWIYPLGVAPLLTCLAGAEVSGTPALFMVLLMGAAGMNGLHDNRSSVIISWVCCAFGFLVLSHAQDPTGWGLGAAGIASVMHLTISLMVFFKAEQHRAALDAATKATREAQTALGLANEAVKTRERFLANMTHELRTPLSGIIGMGELLPSNVSPEVKDIMDTINVSATSLLEIVNDVLMFSKGKSGTLELKKSVFSPLGAIREAVRSISSQAHQKGLELQLDFASDVPDSMMGDELRFRQVMINLVGNALKFTQRGSVVVRVSHLSGPGSVCVEVVDTGIGIPRERLASVFEAFVQVDDSHSRRFGGTGLGLAITSHLIELMGGTLQVESEEGVGSAFRFSIPAGAVEQRPPLPTIDGWLKDRRTAFVAGTSREFVKRTLEQAGAETVELRSLSELPEGGFSLAVVDLGPEGRWSELVEAAGHVPVVALLTPEQRAAHAGEQINGLMMVEKPYSVQDLQVAVNRLKLFSMPRSMGPVAHAGQLDALVVEDNSINARVAVGLLGKLGHRAVVAKNGVEALRELAVRRFDIVLMDMQMPEMDGLEATARIRRDELGTHRHLPILMVTANTLPEHEEASLRAGADAMLAKPLSPEKLARMLRLLLVEGSRDAA